jgi:putative peptidoglycan lipid II flippase
MSRMLKSSGAVAAATLLSRVLGFFRESAYAHFFGDTAVASAFILAFQFPNLLRRLLGEGALTAVFVPVFKQNEKDYGARSTWKGAGAVVSALVLVCTVLVLVGMLVATAFIHWVPMTADHELMLRLLRVMLPYTVFVCVAAVFVGLLNTQGQFFVPALGTTLLNVVMIGSVYLLAPRFGVHLEQQVYGVAVGVVIAGVCQAAFQWPAVRRAGFQFAFRNPFQDPMVREVGRRLLPATLGVAAYQFNVVATQFIADREAFFAVASYNYAVRLMELPQGVIGVSLATFLLTELSSLASEKRYPEFRTALRDGVLHVVFLNLLATGLLLVLAEPVVRLLFEHGKFNADSTARATFALQCLIPGLVAFSFNNILGRAFYALGDTTTPMRIGVFCLLVNVMLVWLLVQPFAQGGLGMANTISALVNAGLLSYAWRRKMPKFDFAELYGPAARMAGLAVAATGLAWLAHRAWEVQVGHQGFGRQVGAVFLPALLASAAYLGLSVALHVPQASELLATVNRRLGRKPAKPKP